MPDDDISSSRYELKELAARAGVTARTIHFYIQQGLLPPAGQSGPGARYSEAHLARLLLVRRLQREHLPLAEIRQRLGALDDQSVVRLAVSTSPKAASASQKGSALDYIRALLGGTAPEAEVRASVPRRQVVQADADAAQLASRILEDAPTSAPRVGRSAAPPTAPSPPTRPLSSARWAIVRAPASTPAPVSGERSQWERIVLASDIELHIRRPLTREQNKRVERLVQAAREILRGEV